MTSSFRNAFGATLLGLAAVAAAPTASAAIITGSWDPALPAVFGNLGWSATINVDISDACLRPDGSTPLMFNLNIFGRTLGCRGSPVALAPFTILSAQIGIYDLTSGLIVDVLTLNPRSFRPTLLQLGPGSSIDYLFSSTDSNDVGTRATEFDQLYAFDADYLTARFKLDLPGPAPNILYQLASTGGFQPGSNPTTQTAFVLSENVLGATVVQNTRLIVGQSVFSVPEPGSLALALLALGAAGAAASRRTRRSDCEAAVTA